MFAGLLLVRAAHADPLADLEKAHSAYVAHRYDDAEARLRVLLDPKTGELKDPNSIADARMYLGAVLVEQRRREEADEVFEKLLTDKFDYRPDELLVSQDAINVFLDARTRLRERIRKKQDEEAARKVSELAAAEAANIRQRLRMKQLEELASEEHVVEKSSRLLALLPFGVGQFQNGQDDLGWVFLSTEALLAVGSAVGAVITIYDANQANDALGRRDDTAAWDNHANAHNAAIAADAMAGGFLLAAVIGAVQAQVKFVPEHVRVRKRPLPPLSLSPVVGPSGVGLFGRF
ncbi:MAG: hypothetical protein JOZ69_18050 [Myxococcales bacterium]|nr:hypothetical protein [Myxococcales bacterium]